mmetsp:Transcript_91730/g.165638  ORF Transcript_91730/g.165638 Transcript_91730/m.165638 type:complete len:213 (+) Transcript_91730:501-1139(+)
MHHALEEADAEAFALRQFGQHCCWELLMVPDENYLLTSATERHQHGRLTSLSALVHNHPMEVASFAFRVEDVHATADASGHHHPGRLGGFPHHVARPVFCILALPSAYALDSEMLKARVEVVGRYVRVGHGQNPLPHGPVDIRPSCHDGAGHEGLACAGRALYHAQALLQGLGHRPVLRRRQSCQPGALALQPLQLPCGTLGTHHSPHGLQG